MFQSDKLFFIFPPFRSIQQKTLEKIIFYHSLFFEILALGGFAGAVCYQVLAHNYKPTVVEQILLYATCFGVMCQSFIGMISGISLKKAQGYFIFYKGRWFYNIVIMIFLIVIYGRNVNSLFGYNVRPNGGVILGILFIISCLFQFFDFGFLYIAYTNQYLRKDNDNENEEINNLQVKLLSVNDEVQQPNEKQQKMNGVHKNGANGINGSNGMNGYEGIQVVI